MPDCAHPKTLRMTDYGEYETLRLVVFAAKLSKKIPTRTRIR
jgi:hypothetical protein